VERLIGALRLLPAARRPRLVQLGTVHEYGPVPQGTPVTELTPPAPVTEYARAKLAASRAVLGAAGIDAVVLRMANTIGPHPAPGSFLGSLAARFTEAAASPGERIELTVAAGARRDYVDVRDAADAVVRAAFAGHLGPDQRLFNIGTGTARGIDTLVLALAQACGLPASALALQTGEVAAQGASTGMVAAAVTGGVDAGDGRDGARDLLRDVLTLPSPGPLAQGGPLPHRAGPRTRTALRAGFLALYAWRRGRAPSRPPRLARRRGCLRPAQA
jgi:nucleoside-diphosphate-sugar epimerase